MKRNWIPWLVAGVFAAGFAVVLIARRGAPNAINGVTQDNSGRLVVTWVDPMYAQGPPHLYKSNHPGVAPDCGMKLVAKYEEAGGGQRAAGGGGNVALVAAELRDLSRTTKTVGRVTVDERRVAQIHSKFEGTVERIYINFIGQQVHRGDALLAIYSPELLATQNELILAERNYSDLGRTLAEAARSRLRLLDMSAADIDRIVRAASPVRDVILRSPVDGVVTTKNAQAGARVMPSDTLYEIADLSRVWVVADVYESELPYVRVGSTAQVIAGGHTLNGRVMFIGPLLTPQTRTASARIELDDRDGLLKPEMYADVILQEPIGSVLAIPDSAVMNTGTRSVVFIRGANGEFEPRPVMTGAKVQGFYEVRSGLAPGERVVADANFLVDSEARLKSALSQMGGMR